ncbi:MAG: hypothetical protein ACJ76F_00165 [Bacteroidia bacterium]
MKGLLKLSISCILALSLFSCKNSVELMKRHYNQGFYVSHKSSKNKVKEHKVHTSGDNEATIASVPVKMLPEKKNDPVMTASLQKSALPSIVPANPEHSLNKRTDKAIAAPHKNVSKLSMQHQKHKKAMKAGRNESDLNIVIMIILCFFPFICLIPVYLHDGKKVTLNFWLTLLLHLTFIGYIIYSILVVLDVVDLS